MTASRQDGLTVGYETHRRELTTYLTRMVVREDVAQELVQETAVRALEASRLPDDPRELRAWLFRIATNLAIDHLRRHSTFKESLLLDDKERASRDGAFVAESRLLRGSPEVKSIAREHLVICFACTLRNLRPEQSAALLLKEVYGFTVAETGELMGATFGQVKNWIQTARATLEAKYAQTCALVAQKGVCYQCVELDGFFDANRGDPTLGRRRSRRAPRDPQGAKGHPVGNVASPDDASRRRSV